jgi:hypothetical protein
MKVKTNLKAGNPAFNLQVNNNQAGGDTGGGNQSNANNQVTAA